jgi:soluble lytic murein transglycosylase-like protein
MKKWIQLVSLLGTFMCCAVAFATDLAVLQNGFSIRHEHREVLGSVTRLYTGADDASYVDVPTFQIAHFERDLSPETSPDMQDKNAESATNGTPPAKPAIKAPTLDEVINRASDRHEIDPDLISSVIHAESGFNPRALSPKGAQGLMQLMPKTALNLGVANAFDPGANVEGGTRYLRELLELYNFDLVKALAAYNAGPLRVRQYRGVPPYNETRAYVARIIRDFNRKKLAEQKAAALAGKNKKQVPARSSPVTQIIVKNPSDKVSR